MSKFLWLACALATFIAGAELAEAQDSADGPENSGNVTVNAEYLRALEARRSRFAAESAIDACSHRQTQSRINPTGYWCVAHIGLARRQDLTTLVWEDDRNVWRIVHSEEAAPANFDLEAGQSIEFCAVRAANFDNEHDGWQGYGVAILENGGERGRVSVGDHCTRYELDRGTVGQSIRLTAYADNPNGGNVAVFGFWYAADHD